MVNSLILQNFRLFESVSLHFEAPVVFLCGSMLNGKELEIAKQLLNEVKAEANKAGDKEVYRFDVTPQAGDLGYGNDWHPSVLQHKKMAAELAAYLSDLMHWLYL